MWIAYLVLEAASHLPGVPQKTLRLVEALVVSVHATAWAWRQEVGDAGAKLVLIKLADQANDRGECWPSQKTLAAECEMSRRTVQRKLELLYERGLVVAEQRTRETGADTSLLYRIKPGGSQSDAPPVDTDDAGGTSPVTHLEPSLEPTSPVETGEGVADAPRARDEIWDFLEETFGSVGTDRRAQAHQKRNKAIADLRRLGATPDGIRYAIDAWSRRFVGATLTDIALATHYPQLAAGRGETISVSVAAPLPPAAILRERAVGLERGLKQGVCAECGVGGGRHTADCALARETPRRAYEHFIRETAGNAAYPLDEIGRVIDSWRDLADVERQHYRDLAEEIRANHEQEAA